MPVQAEDGRADWLLDVLAHPPEAFEKKSRGILNVEGENKVRFYIIQLCDDNT